MPNSKKTIELFDKLNKALFRMDSTDTYTDVVEDIGSLAISVKSDEDSDWFLGESGACTLDQLLVGAFWFFTDYHGGMFSPEYRSLSRLSEIYNPGMTHGPEPESPEVSVYEALEGLYKSWMESKRKSLLR